MNINQLLLEACSSLLAVVVALMTNHILIRMKHRPRLLILWGILKLLLSMCKIIKIIKALIFIHNCCYKAKSFSHQKNNSPFLILVATEAMRKIQYKHGQPLFSSICNLWFKKSCSTKIKPLFHVISLEAVIKCSM